MAVSSISACPGVAPVVMMMRPGLTAMVAFSALVGYLAAAPVPDWSVACVLYAGIALLSAAASVLNQLQERDSDARMARTRLRPLVTGELRSVEAALLVVGCAAAGLILLAAVGAAATLAGMMALLLYNGAYTPLKRYSSFALLPGALSGALPVAAGWLAAAGSVSDPRLYSLLIFMILWQVPHSVCLVIRERDDFTSAGLALVPDSINTVQLVHLTRLWVAALAIGGLLLAASGIFSHPLLARVAIALLGWLVLCSLLPFRISCPEAFASALGGRLKLFLAAFLLLLLADALLV